MDGAKIMSQPWFPDLLRDVHSAIAERHTERLDARPALEEQQRQLEAQMQGWLQSLGNASLPASLRTDLESKYTEAGDRHREIATELESLNHCQTRVHELVDPDKVVERLANLAEVLGNGNASQGNLELSFFIDKIICSADGTVHVKICKLGLAPNAIDLLAVIDEPEELTGVPQFADHRKSKPRKRTRLRVPTADPLADIGALLEFATDTDRFAGIPEQWFWNHELQIPEQSCWSTENSAAVFQRKMEGRLSNAVLAAEFGKSIPTIGSALRKHVEQHPDVAGAVDLKRMIPRRPRIKIEEFAEEAYRLWQEKESKLELARKYNCSEPTLNRALKFAADKLGLPMARDTVRRSERIAQARKLLDAGHRPKEIAMTMKISPATVNTYLNASYRAEGKSMPDLRRKRQ